MSQRPTKNKKRVSQNGDSGNYGNVIPFNKGNFDLIGIYPKPYTRQELAFRSWNNGKNLVMYGFPGTGKTFLALYFALNAVMRNEYKKILIVRSAVPSRDVGFMPGNKKQKAEVYEAPYWNICSELYGRADAYSILKQKNIIEFEITSYLRGLTVDNSIVIIDEFQSMTEHELYTILSRIGENSRVIISGDIGQNDLTKEKSGFPTMLRVFDKMKEIETVEFGIDDIVRSGFVKSLIIARESLKHETIQNKSVISA